MPNWIDSAARQLAWTFSGLLTGLCVTGGTIAVPFLVLSPPVGDMSLDALQPRTQRTLVLHSADGRPFARRGGCVAEPVTLPEIPQHFIDALLSMEDRRFYYHLGVDPIGLARAALHNRGAGRIVQGGSTITQQLIKYSFLSSERTLERKKKEAWLALALELRLSKDEILERYLSSAYFGEGCFGLRAAARQYFGKPVSALTLPESAYLVALLKSPTYLADNTEAAEERTSLVFQAMVENGKLTSQQLEALAPAIPRTKLSDSLGSYYADWVASSIRLSETGDYSPLPVHTAFDAELQRLALDSVKKVLAKNSESHRASQAAMVVMRTDGRVVAMVGGRNHAESQFNRAVQARRQPGSSFKLFVYLAALRAGLSPDTTIADQPFSVGDYKPENFSRRYRGAVSVRHAFASSINTVAVRLSEAVGRDPVIAAARDLGITTPIGRTPSLALGTYEVSLLELTSAYCAIAAGAYPIKPWAITDFGTSKDLRNPPKGSGSWRLEEKEAMRMLLRGTVQQGSGRKARLPIAAYGKTGTSQEYRDAWFVGFAGNLVVGVWVGNDDFSPMKRVTGGSLPAEIWQSFMREAIRSDKEFKHDLEETDVFPANPRTSDELIQIATDTLGSAATHSQRSNRASNQAKRPNYGSRNGWKNKWAERRGQEERRQGLASRGFLQHLFQ